jgi:hypothetical protein
MMRNKQASGPEQQFSFDWDQLTKPEVSQKSEEQPSQPAADLVVPAQSGNRWYGKNRKPWTLRLSPVSGKFIPMADDQPGAGDKSRLGKPDVRMDRERDDVIGETPDGKKIHLPDEREY